MMTKEKLTSIIKKRSAEFYKFHSKNREIINKICKQIGDKVIKLDECSQIGAICTSFDEICDGSVVELKIENGFLTLVYRPIYSDEKYDCYLEDFVDEGFYFEIMEQLKLYLNE